MLDDCNFHESVSLDRFDTERTLELVPPNGEFAVMNYRCNMTPSSHKSCLLIDIFPLTLFELQCSSAAISSLACGMSHTLQN